MVFDTIPLHYLIIAGAVVLVAIGALTNLFREKKRREALQRVADGLGLSFYQDGDPDLVRQLSDLPLFSNGRKKRTTNMIHGETDDVVMGVFDYRYTTGSGKNSHTYRQTVAFFRSNDLDLPTFEMRPQKFFHGIGKMFGYQDIDFETHPTFSKAFLLRGPNEEGVRATFGSELLTAMEQNQGVCVEGRGHDLIFYRRTKLAGPDQFKGLMSEGFEVLSLFRIDAGI